MATHEYSPTEALQTLIDEIDKFDPAFANEISLIVNDIRYQDAESVIGESVGLSINRDSAESREMDAVKAAALAIRSLFIDLAFGINSAIDDMGQRPVFEVASDLKEILTWVPMAEPIQIESADGPGRLGEMTTLIRTSDESLEIREAYMTDLERLLNFD